MNSEKSIENIQTEIQILKNNKNRIKQKTHVSHSQSRVRVTRVPEKEDGESENFSKNV